MYKIVHRYTHRPPMHPKIRRRLRTIHTLIYTNNPKQFQTHPRHFTNGKQKNIFSKKSQNTNDSQ